MKLGRLAGGTYRLARQIRESATRAIWTAANELTSRSVATEQSGNACLDARTVNPSPLFSGARMCEDGCL